MGATVVAGSEREAIERPDGIEVIVRSQKVASEVEEVPYYSGIHHYLGPTAVLRSRKIVYRRKLDDEQERLVETARGLADSAGLELRIRDISKEGIVRRFLRIAMQGRRFTPTLTLFGHAGSQLAVRTGGSISTSFLLAQNGERAHGSTNRLRM